MSTAVPQPAPHPYFTRRHALGLPAGSVRAAHVLGVVGVLCGILLVPAARPIAVPPYLVYLLFLILGHFFAAHGTTIATRADPHPSPLHLPGGVLRVLVVLMLIGTIGWKWYSDAEGLRTQFNASLDELKAQPFMPLVVLGGFLLGALVRGLIGRQAPAAWQDFEAWVSVLALVGIFVAALIHVIIEPSRTDRLPTEHVEENWHVWESILGGVIAFYFGERS